jgi:hypothetical protein
MDSRAGSDVNATAPNQATHCETETDGGILNLTFCKWYGENKKEIYEPDSLRLVVDIDADSYWSWV